MTMRTCDPSSQSTSYAAPYAKLPRIIIRLIAVLAATTVGIVAILLLINILLFFKLKSRFRYGDAVDHPLISKRTGPWFQAVRRQVGKPSENS